MTAALIGLLLSPAWAEIKIEVPNPRPPRAKSHQVLTAEFAAARGLKSHEIHSMHYNRISCNRRMFTPSGQSLEGDGNLKVTRINNHLVEMEFPTQITFSLFGAINPFKNGISDIETATSRQLVNLRDWQEGQSLALPKVMTVYPENENASPEQVDAMVEVRIIDATYPKMYIVRETVLTEPKFSYYFLCE